MGIFTHKKKFVQNPTFWRKKGSLALMKAKIAIGYMRFKMNSLWLKIVSFMSMFIASGLLNISVKKNCMYISPQKNPRSASLFKDRI